MLNFEWLSNVPVHVARWIFLGLFVLIGIGVWRIPTHSIFAGIDERRWWYDLRWWATGALMLIFITYLIF